MTIIADRGLSADCDGLSTTCLALGKERAAELIAKTEGIGGILVDAAGSVTKINADGFSEAN